MRTYKLVAVNERLHHLAKIEAARENSTIREVTERALEKEFKERERKRRKAKSE